MERMSENLKTNGFNSQFEIVGILSAIEATRFPKNNQQKASSNYSLN